MICNSLDIETTRNALTPILADLSSVIIDNDILDQSGQSIHVDWRIESVVRLFSLRISPAYFYRWNSVDFISFYDSSICFRYKNNNFGFEISIDFGPYQASYNKIELSHVPQLLEKFVLFLNANKFCACLDLLYRFLVYCATGKYWLTNNRRIGYCPFCSAPIPDLEKSEKTRYLNRFDRIIET